VVQSLGTAQSPSSKLVEAALACETWRVKFRPPVPPLDDGVIALRPFLDEDVPELVEALADPEVSRWTTIPFPYSEEDGRAWVKLADELWRKGAETSFAVTEAATGRLVGGIGMGVRAGNGTFGYWIREDARGRGLAPAALRLLCRWAVDEVGLARLQLMTIPGNTSSERVAEKLGFQREGLLRRYFAQRDNRVDVWMWSLLPDDPP
jgi:RimJ/RimL family protein N-acetyltransferase